MSAELIDIPSACGHLDPSPHLDQVGAQVLADTSLLFPEGLGSEPQSVPLHGGARLEYLKVVVKQLRGGKLALLQDALAAAQVFCVGKRGSHKLREVWHGGGLTSCAARAPKPPLQASPAALANLECSLDRPLVASGRDAAAFFDQLRLPEHLVPYMGRPSLFLEELLDESLGVDFCLSPAELASFCNFEVGQNFAVSVTPCSRVWPMGFGWSSYVAQSYMVGTVRAAGFGDSQLLCEEWTFPPLDEPSLTIATDDVVMFTRASADELLDADRPSLGALDAVWSNVGVVPQSSKGFDDVSCCTALGISLRGGVALTPRSDRLGTIPDASADLLSRGACSPKQLSSFIGVLQWQNLLNRPLFSCLGSVYAFCQLADDNTVTSLWPSVLSEITLNVCLLHFWIIDLTAGWMNVIGATDASPSFGYGMGLASISPDALRAAAAEAYGPDCVFRQTPTASELAAEKPRRGRLYRLPLRTRHFKRIFTIKARLVEHSGAMEADAATLGLARLARCRRLHASRGLLLVDAKVVEAALRKGRSSAPSLRRPIARSAGILLAAGFRMRYGYIPSESNLVADAASRGAKPVGRIRPCASRPNPSKLDLLLERKRVAASVGFGDGPPFGSSIAGHESCGSSLSGSWSDSSYSSDSD